MAASGLLWDLKFIDGMLGVTYRDVFDTPWVTAHVGNCPTLLPPAQAHEVRSCYGTRSLYAGYLECPLGCEHELHTSNYKRRGNLRVRLRLRACASGRSHTHYVFVTYVAHTYRVIPTGRIKVANVHAVFEWNAARLGRRTPRVFYRGHCPGTW